jgi:hypothetical protein
MTWVAALEEAELLCSVISDNGKGVVILHQAPLAPNLLWRLKLTRRSKVMPIRSRFTLLGLGTEK